MIDSPFNQRIKLKPITTKIGSGATPRGGKNSYKSEGITLIRSLNVYDFEFSLDGLAYIDEEQAEELANVEVKTNDILLNITGASVARCCIVPNEMLPARVNQHVAIVRVDPTLADAHYVMYCLNSPIYKNHLLTLAQGGATREALTKTTIQNFEIPYPPLETQRRIAAILSAYDDLIENNTQRIAALEAAAQALYREWFVEFRFPGYESVQWADSALGTVPRGWEVVTVSDLYQTGSGGTPSRKKPEYFGGRIHWVKTQELKDGFIFESEEEITELGLEKSSARLFPPKTVLMAMYGATIGQLGILAEPAATNQACCAFLPKKDAFGYAYIYLYLLSNHQELIGLGMGAAQQNISQQVIKAFQILQPPVSTMRSFNDLAEPKFDQIEVLQRRNTLLREARDLLLPRLISGELSVSAVEELSLEDE